MPPEDRALKVKRKLDQFHLAEHADKFVYQLSGGLKQLVSICRATVYDPRLLLLDEPFSALDYITRLRMRGELARLLRERPRTVVLVTHDIEEASQLADRVFVLSGRPGRIVRELCIHSPRQRDITHPEVVRAMHTILAELGLESNGRPATESIQESAALSV